MQDAEKVARALKQAQYVTLTLRNLTDSVITKPGAGTMGLDPQGKEGNKNPQDEGDDKVNILVARSDIAAKTSLTGKAKDFFEVKQMPKSALPTNNDYLTELTHPVFQDANLVAMIDLKSGEPVSARFLGKTDIVTSSGTPIQSDKFEQKIFNGDRIAVFGFEKQGDKWVMVGGALVVVVAPTRAALRLRRRSRLRRRGRAARGSNVTQRGRAGRKAGPPPMDFFQCRRVGWGERTPAPRNYQGTVVGADYPSYTCQER